jgi:hypothetical protein
MVRAATAAKLPIHSVIGIDRPTIDSDRIVEPAMFESFLAALVSAGTAIAAYHSRI